MIRVLTRFTLMLTAVVFLAACSSGTKGRCHKVREYQKAESAPFLVIPEGLAPLDPNLRLKIPDGPLNLEAVPEGQPCLDYPPRYFREG